jgi:murein DD-endopeptidase MepM/ murein hydrolase activator NlpD
MGKILYASLVTSGKTHALYRFTSPVDGSIDYYDERGQSAKKFLMRTPVDGARLSSGYGMRFHPILGYSKMHKGVDFAAPRGTPVMAAGQGTVDYASRYGSYGNYIRISHGNGYKTAYAHLNSFARGIKKGAHVRQGQIIGYVGTTGRSTGPHLHYEVLVANKQVNPMSIRVPTGRKLAGSELASFAAARTAIGTEMAAATVLSSTATADIAQPSNATVKR